MSTPQQKTPARDPRSSDEFGPEPQGAGRTALETRCLIDASKPLDENLRQRVVGQDSAVDRLVCSYSRLLSGLHDPSRPLLTMLLLGPTGVGKTETAKAMAYTLFGSERAMTRINCEEYAHGHELSKLPGSPPGYVGSNIEPLLSQNNLDRHHRQLLESRHRLEPERPLPAGPDEAEAVSGRFQSILLFDEVEKAHPVVWKSLLGILEDGMLTLGTNETTDFTRSIIFMTSNVGSQEMNRILDPRSVGFVAAADGRSDTATLLKEAAMGSARGVFPLEFLNRIDEILVYSALERRHLEKIFDKFLADLHTRALQQAGMPLLIQVSSDAKQWIVDRGSDLTLGARPLRRAVERELVDPLSRLIASSQIEAGDVVEVELDSGRLVFFRSQRTKRVVG